MTGDVRVCVSDDESRSAMRAKRGAKRVRGAKSEERVRQRVRQRVGVGESVRLHREVGQGGAAQARQGSEHEGGGQPTSLARAPRRERE